MKNTSLGKQIISLQQIHLVPQQAEIRLNWGTISQSSNNEANSSLKNESMPNDTTFRQRQEK